MELVKLFKPNQFTFKHFKEDLLAGAITGIVAIPLGLALAIASGAPAIYGIYTSIIAGVLVALFGSSELGVSGAAAAMTVLLFGVVAKFGIEGLLLAGFLAGLIQIALGATGIGRVVKFIPYSVIVGFTTGIGVLILIGQLGNLTGINTKAEGVIAQLQLFTTNLAQLNPLALALGIVTLALIFLIPKINRKLPATFVALVIASIAAIVLSLSVKTIGAVPSGLPPFSTSFLNFQLAAQVFPSAIAIALLASIESLLSAVAADGMTGTKHSSSKELAGQGIANAILPFFSAIPCTGVIVRTATNIKNGAKTRLSAIIHSLVLILVVLFFAPLASQIPMTVLAGILIVTAIRLISIEEIKRLIADSRSEFTVFLATVTATVLLDLTLAILIGFVLAGLVFIKKMSESTKVSIVPAPAHTIKEPTLHPDVAGVANTYKVSGPLFFASAFELEKIEEDTPSDYTPHLVLDMQDVDYMDASAIETLSSIIEKRKQTGEVYLVISNPGVKKKILTSEIMHFLQPTNIVLSVDEGLKKAKQATKKKN